jgi:molybdopterin/thiamine biosynthesis adenylyltransferase
MGNMWESIIDRQTGFVNFTGKMADACRQTRVAVFGCGGNGAILDALVRVGFERFEIADYDTVEASNLNRLPFGIDLIDVPKVEAWKRYLATINPACQVTAHRRRITHKDRDWVAAVIERNDIVALGTTSPEANLVISRLCHRAARRMVVGPASSGSLVVSTFTHTDDVTLESLGCFGTEHLALNEIDYQSLTPLYARLVYYPGRKEKIDGLARRQMAGGELEARSCKIFVSLTNAAMCWEMVKNVAVMNDLPLENTQVIEMPVMQIFDPYKGAAYYWNYRTEQIGIPDWATEEIHWREWKE